MTARRLSMLDTTFLQLESRRTPMHVAALMLFELPEGASAEFVGDIVQRFRAVKIFRNPWNYRLRRASRLQFLPRLEEVQDVDLEYHVRHLSLPRPGGERELGQLIARLHSQPLDLRKPLWEVHLVEGLGQNRFALYVKVHHALADGISATRMLIGALSTEARSLGQLPFWAVDPDARGKGSPPAAPAPAAARPSLTAMAAASRAAWRTWTARSDGEEVTLRNAPKTLLNQDIYSQRRFATHTEPLARLKAIAKAADASLNDVVLALVGSTLRDYLGDHDVLPRRSLTAAVPVSLHVSGDTRIGNNVSMMFATLGTHIADDGVRLEAVKASTRAGKERLRSLPAGSQQLYPALVLAPFFAGVAAGINGRLRPPFNVIVSNVPGAPDERYLFGARLAHCYPVSIPTHGGALNVTCFSHAGQLNFGLVACRDSVPHVQQMAVNLGPAVDRLEEIYCGRQAADRKVA